MKQNKTKRKKGNSKKAAGHTATAIANYDKQGLTWIAHRGSRGLIRLLFYFYFSSTNHDFAPVSLPLCGEISVKKELYNSVKILL